MKRDMDLVRKWLLHISGECEFRKEDYPHDVWCTHLAMLIDAGLVHGVRDWDVSNPGVAAFASYDRLTWAGYDFLDAARDQSVWDTALQRARKLGGAVSFEVLKALLNDVALNMLGLKSA